MKREGRMGRGRGKMGGKNGMKKGVRKKGKKESGKGEKREEERRERGEGGGREDEKEDGLEKGVRRGKGREERKEKGREEERDVCCEHGHTPVHSREVPPEVPSPAGCRDVLGIHHHWVTLGKRGVKDGNSFGVKTEIAFGVGMGGGRQMDM